MAIRLFILPGVLCGLSSTAASQTRQPVISKVEILFSMVSHYSHIADRVAFYDNYGVPKGNTNYAVPHLVYEPTVTLYNPYNEPLTMTRSRVKIWDPPIGFTFRKNGTFLRSDFSSGIFHGLAQFQVANEHNPGARKSFTLSLSSPTASGAPGGEIVLQPGESQTFSTWVEKDWTWGLETAGGYLPRSFHDWNANSDFTNRDPRTSNWFGAEAVFAPVPLSFFGDPRAGFQTDFLSHMQARPTASLYDFENAHHMTGGWVATRLNDTIGVQAKAMRTLSGPIGSDFQVELLKGENQESWRDLVRTYPVSLAGIIQNQQNPVISRVFTMSQILQHPADKSLGGKSPFAALTMIAKTSALRANRFHATPAVPTAELYELHFREVVSEWGIPAMPSDAPFGVAPQIHGVSRSGDTLFIDFSGGADAFGTKTWKVRGSSAPAEGFPDPLDSSATIITGMSGSGIYKAIIDISGRGERYFVRIEE